MHRSGWARKSNQEQILGIWISKTDFIEILKNSVHSSFKENVYKTKEKWQKELKSKEVRLQWDPDHDLHEQKQNRKAIQLGLKNKVLKKFNDEMITEIVDMTDFVVEQRKLLRSKQYKLLKIPDEKIFEIEDKNLCKILLIDVP